MKERVLALAAVMLVLGAMHAYASQGAVSAPGARPGSTAKPSPTPTPTPTPTQEGRQPTLGETVLYVDTDGRGLAAIVTLVRPETSDKNLDDDEPAVHNVDLVVFDSDREQTRWAHHVTYDGQPSPEPGSWHYRYLAGTLMSDPWPTTEEDHELIREFLDEEAQARGSDNWVVAFHEFQP